MVKKIVALQSGSFNLLFKKDLSSLLKQQALFFDHIGLLRLSKVIQSLRKFPIQNDEARKRLDSEILEIEFLVENNIIFEPEIPAELFLYTKIGNQYLPEIARNNGEIREILENKEQSDNVLIKLIDIGSRQESMLLRLLTFALKKSKGITTVTTLPEFDYMIEVPNSHNRDVIQVTINNLPVPDGQTSWEQIIDYRNDPETQKQLFSLRRWINKISTQNLPPTEIQDEIESLIFDFQEHMNIHKIKSNIETLEVLVKTPLELIENLVKLKFSKLPEPFFALKKRQLLLMEAEINAPGKELAYLIKSRETFQP